VRGRREKGEKRNGLPATKTQVRSWQETEFEGASNCYVYVHEIIVPISVLVRVTITSGVEVAMLKSELCEHN
jgi:hypothetical protein